MMAVKKRTALKKEILTKKRQIEDLRTKLIALRKESEKIYKQLAEIEHSDLLKYLKATLYFRMNDPDGDATSCYIRVKKLLSESIIADRIHLDFDECHIECDQQIWINDGSFDMGRFTPMTKKEFLETFNKYIEHYKGTL